MSATAQCARAHAAVYSERALRRLEIAARLLRRRDLTRDRLGERFGPVILEVIERLEVQARERLRAQVDWVEAYELAEVRLTSGRSRYARAR